MVTLLEQIIYLMMRDKLVMVGILLFCVNKIKSSVYLFIVKTEEWHRPWYGGVKEIIQGRMDIHEELCYFFTKKKKKKKCDNLFAVLFTKEINSWGKELAPRETDSFLQEWVSIDKEGKSRVSWIIFSEEFLEFSQSPPD